jgi:hypothetical protein
LKNVEGVDEVVASGHLGPERRGAYEKSDRLAALGLGCVVASELDLARLERDESGDDAHGGGFSGSVGSQQSDDLSGADEQGEILEGPMIAVGMAELVDKKGGW